MMKILFILLILFTTANQAFSENPDNCSKSENFVTRVIDGDTIEIETGDLIRILGIDAYDSSNSRMIGKQIIRTGYKHHKVKFLGQKATSFAIDNLLHKCVTLLKDKKNKGAYNRLLRYVMINDRDYQLMILRENLANVYCGDKKIKNYQKYLKFSKFKCN